MSSIFRSDQGRQEVLERQQQFIERWPDAVTTTMAPTRHGDTFVVGAGPSQAPPVVLLHGAGFNSAAWTGDIPTWSTSRRVFAVDVIGEPGRSAPSRPSFDTDAYAVWIDDVMDHLEVDVAGFVGTSLGGWLAIDYAIRRPGRVSGLAALVPAGIGRQRYRALLSAALLMPFGSRGRRAAMTHILGPRAEHATGDEELADAFDDYLWLIQRSYRPRRDRLPIFTDDQLAGMTMPLMVIAGADDRLIDAHHTAQRLSALQPEATVTLLRNTGHIPSNYTDAIHEFLTAGSEQ